MGLMSRLHWEIYSEPAPESEYVGIGEQEYEGRESEACRIKAKERERLVREKCARVAQSLRTKKECRSR